MPGESESIGQHEIEQLLAQAKQGASPASAPPEAPASAPPPAATPQRPAEGIAQGDIDYLLHQAEAALASINAPPQPTRESPAVPFKLRDLGSAPASTEVATLDLIRDVELDVKIELGRTQMYLEDVLKLRKGAVVPLDKLAGDPVDIYVNGRLIARGEVLVLNENFCVRVAELVAGEAAA
jgi:flagellar motor switch protein FliN/FliY